MNRCLNKMEPVFRNFAALSIIFLISQILTLSVAYAQVSSGGIRPYPENPFYWEYKGKPLVLLGGTWQDNLFNHPEGLEAHLDRLAKAGGNYIRNTMSSRNAANVYPYVKNEKGLYDLERWNEEYWARLKNLLKLTAERDIIIQVELWDPHDHCADHQHGGWSFQPFNPKNNINYTAAESGLPLSVDYRPSPKPSAHTFFRTVPKLQNNQLVLGYQQKFIDKILSITFQYSNVLYCMNNEMGERLEWGDYWIRYIRGKAGAQNLEIQTTDMRRNNDITAEDHMFAYQHPELYTFVDISQNNSQNIPTGQLHYDRILKAREIIQEESVRPMNNVKIYSREEGKHIDGPQRFWRIIFGGCASARFHRPHPLEGGPVHHYARSFHGLGLHPDAQINIRSARMLLMAIDIFHCLPSNHLLGNRDDNGAFCLAEEGKQYAVYFTDGGEVELDLSGLMTTGKLRWLDIERCLWIIPRKIRGKEQVEITAPGKGPWVALIQPVD